MTKCSICNRDVILYEDNEYVVCKILATDDEIDRILSIPPVFSHEELCKMAKATASLVRFGSQDKYLTKNK